MIRIGAVLAFFLGWFIIGHVGGGLFVPTPESTIVRLVELAQGPIWGPLLESNISLFIGFPAASILGIALGSLLARNTIADRALGFYVDALMVIPTISIVPIIVVAFGLTLNARVVVVMLFVLPIVALTTRGAITTVDAALLQMARSFGAGVWFTWRTVMLPAVLGPIASGLRVALAHGIAGMIVIELVLTPVGIGGMLQNSRARFDAPELYAVTLAILLEGFILVGLATVGERVLQRRLSHSSKATK